MPMLLLIFIAVAGCSSAPVTQNQPAVARQPKVKTVNPFDDYLKAEFPPANGFDFPVGGVNGEEPYVDQATGKAFGGWHVAAKFGELYSLGIHPGEDWNGIGGGNTDLGQEVRAIANGQVAYAKHCGALWGNVVMVDHLYYENSEKKRIRSSYAHLLDTQVKEGDSVEKGQTIGHIGQDPDKLYSAHLHIELRTDEALEPTYWPSSNGKDLQWVQSHYAPPSEFIRERRALPMPQKETVLVLVDQKTCKMRLYLESRLAGEYEVSFGQERGPKRLQGDNRTPSGMYFVTTKSRGHFGEGIAAFYGGHWIKINYPNRYDALRGVKEGIISAQTAATITSLWKKREPTIETTRLGGGIGFHGWIEEWDNGGSRHLSWGCIVMHLYDIRKVYDLIPGGTMVVIF